MPSGTSWYEPEQPQGLDFLFCMKKSESDIAGDQYATFLGALPSCILRLRGQEEVVFLGTNITQQR